jgi:hypothetical protein
MLPTVTTSDDDDLNFASHNSPDDPRDGQARQQASDSLYFRHQLQSVAFNPHNSNDAESGVSDFVRIIF